MNGRGIGQPAAVATLAVIGAFVAASTAQAAVTIGSNLGRAPSSPDNQNTLFNTSLLPSLAAQGGLASPVSGVVTSWRVRTGNTGGSVALRVIRPLGSSQFFGAGTSAPHTLALDTTSPPLPAQLPISVNDLIGIDCLTPGGCDNLVPIAGATLQAVTPRIPEGQSRTPTSGSIFELTVQAEIEPTNTFTATAKAKSGGKVKVSATLPNQGLLTVGDKKPPSGSSAGAAKTPSLLKRARVQLAAPGDTTLTVKPNKKGKRVLDDDGKVKVKLRLTYTPTFGTAFTDTIKIKLKD